MDKEIKEKIDKILKTYLARTTAVNQFGLREKLLELFIQQEKEILADLRLREEELLNKIDMDYKNRDITIYELGDWLKQKLKELNTPAPNPKGRGK